MGRFSACKISSLLVACRRVQLKHAPLSTAAQRVSPSLSVALYSFCACRRCISSFKSGLSGRAPLATTSSEGTRTADGSGCDFEFEGIAPAVTKLQQRLEEVEGLVDGDMTEDSSDED